MDSSITGGAGVAAAAAAARVAHRGMMSECTAEAACALFEAGGVTTAPRIRQTTLGKRWSVDVVAVVHNAIRAELGDLLEMLATLRLAALAGRLGAAELRSLFAWFASFETFAVAALKAEEEVLYPWLEQWGRIDGALSTGSRIAAKGAIIRSIRDAAAASATLGLQHLPAGGALRVDAGDELAVGFADIAVVGGGDGGADEHVCQRVLEAVVTHVTRFGGAMGAYFREQEEALPAMIERLYDAEDVRSSAVDRRTVRAIWRSGRRDEATLIVARGLGGDRALMRAWTQRCLRRIDRMSLPLWRRRYHAGRGAVVERFRSKKVRYHQLLALQGRSLMTGETQEVARNTLSTPFPAVTAQKSWRSRVRRMHSHR